MNEEENILNEKIRKREKFDTILAYILLVIILLAIGLIVYLKFIRKVETVPEERENNYITLNDISNNLNNSLLANKYRNDGVEFSSNVQNNNLMLNYTKQDNGIVLGIKPVGNELEIAITEDNKEVVEEIYKEIACIICTYYGNSEDSCRNALSSVDENSSISGIRFVNTDNNKYVYIETTKSIEVSNKLVYNEVTKVDLSNNNYELNIDNVNIKNINVITNEEAITITGRAESSESANITILATLYGENDEALGEKKYEYNSENPLGETSEFKVEFTLNATLKLENVKTYSISIIK